MANELYRQVVHLALGIVIALGAYVLPRTWFLVIIGVLFALGTLFMLFFASEIKWFYQVFEREHVAFKGKGVLFYGLGVWLTAFLFWDHAALAILVLAIPDALATIAGSSFKSGPLPYNHRKTWLGSAVFFVTASLVISVTLHELSVFFIAFLLTALESFDYREIPFLDDNMVIPLVAGFLLGFV